MNFAKMDTDGNIVSAGHRAQAMHCSSLLRRLSTLRTVVEEKNRRARASLSTSSYSESGGSRLLVEDH